MGACEVLNLALKILCQLFKPNNGWRLPIFGTTDRITVLCSCSAFLTVRLWNLNGIVTMPSSSTHSTWVASEICFTSNGRTGSQTQRSSRGLEMGSIHAMLKRSQLRWAGHMCAACQTNACLRDCSVERWKLVHTLTELNATDKKTHWRFLWSA